jgi:hypothetical protein
MFYVGSDRSGAANEVSKYPADRLVICASLKKYPRPVVLIKGLIHYSDEHSVWKRIYNLAVRAGPDVERSTGGIHYPAPALSRRRRSIAQ